MRRRRVLIVEDEDDLRHLWIDALEGEGYTVLGVNDGALAVAELARFEPDLILLDLIMPRAELDGLAFLSHLSARASFARVPIVVVSGLGDPLSAAIAPETAGTLRIVAIMPKPVNIDTLLTKIDKVIPAAQRPVA